MTVSLHLHVPLSLFRRTLVQAGYVCTVRASKGDDTMAACGQLGDLAAASRPAPMLQPPERLRAALLGGGGAASGREGPKGDCGCGGGGTGAEKS